MRLPLVLDATAEQSGKRMFVKDIKCEMQYEERRVNHSIWDLPYIQMIHLLQRA